MESGRLGAGYVAAALGDVVEHAPRPQALPGENEPPVESVPPEPQHAPAVQAALRCFDADTGMLHLERMDPPLTAAVMGMGREELDQLNALIVSAHENGLRIIQLPQGTTEEDRLALQATLEGSGIEVRVAPIESAAAARLELLPDEAAAAAPQRRIGPFTDLPPALGSHALGFLRIHDRGPGTLVSTRWNEAASLARVIQRRQDNEFHANPVKWLATVHPDQSCSVGNLIRFARLGRMPPMWPAESLLIQGNLLLAASGRQDDTPYLHLKNSNAEFRHPSSSSSARPSPELQAMMDREGFGCCVAGWGAPVGAVLLASERAVAVDYKHAPDLTCPVEALAQQFASATHCLPSPVGLYVIHDSGSVGLVAKSHQPHPLHFEFRNVALPPGQTAVGFHCASPGTVSVKLSDGQVVTSYCFDFSTGAPFRPTEGSQVVQALALLTPQGTAETFLQDDGRIFERTLGPDHLPLQEPSIKHLPGLKRPVCLLCMSFLSFGCIAHDAESGKLVIHAEFKDGRTLRMETDGTIGMYMDRSKGAMMFPQANGSCIALNAHGFHLIPVLAGAELRHDVPGHLALRRP